MIGVFDSGVGGLAIWKQITLQLPTASTIYLADQAFFPYGELYPSSIKRRTFLATNFLIDEGCQIVVIACNTATVNSTINDLRNHYQDTIFVGVEPPIKKVVELSNKNMAALFVTAATAKSLQLKKLINRYTHPSKLTVVPAPQWVNLVEAGLPQPQTTDELFESITKLDSSIEVIGLGCTHFSFLFPLLQKTFSQRHFVDVSKPVANQVSKVYSEDISVSINHRFITTGPTQRLTKFLNNLLKNNSPVESINL